MSLRALPQPGSEAVGIAYLLARYADTLTDSGNLHLDQRLFHLRAWEKSIEDLGPAPTIDSTLFPIAAESQLIHWGPELLAALKALPPHFQKSTQKVLRTLISAMKWDLEKFPAASSASSPVFGCQSELDFETYTYSIAGCVGEFWCEIFDLPSRLRVAAVNYGKALQRINILRDLGSDFSKGRVYLPAVYFADQSRAPWQQKEWAAVVKNYLERLDDLLVDGREFCDSIPYLQFRLRLASRLPLQIGLETRKLFTPEALKISFEVNRPLKIKRAQVYRILLKSLADLLRPR